MLTDTIQIDAEVRRELEKKAYELGLVFGTPNEVLRIVFDLDQSTLSNTTQTTPKQIVPYSLDNPTDVNTGSLPTPSRRQKIGSKLLREHPLIHARKGYFSKFLPAGNTPYQKPTEFPAVLFDPEGYFVIDSEESMLNSSNIRVGKQINVLGGINSIPGYVHCGHRHD